MEEVPQAQAPPAEAESNPIAIAATQPPPTPAAIPQPVSIPSGATTGFCYRTTPGETIDIVATKYGTSPQDISRANDLYPPGYVIGNQTLFIPTSPAVNGPNVYPVQYGEDLPTIDGKPGDGLLALFVAAGLASSNGEVRRAVTGNSVSVNDARVTDPAYTISDSDFGTEGIIKLSLGKKKHALVRRAG